MWDTGASLGLAPYRTDFFDYIEVDFAVNYVTQTNIAIGIGTVIYKVQSDKTRMFSCYSVLIIFCS